MANKFSKAKLLLSKWTAVQPVNREKHFVVTKVLRNELNDVTGCIIEAVHSKRAAEIDPAELKDSDQWLQGWR